MGGKVVAYPLWPWLLGFELLWELCPSFAMDLVVISLIVWENGGAGMENLFEFWILSSWELSDYLWGLNNRENSVSCYCNICDQGVG